MKIGLLTSGGDCQALNAAMRGVVKALYENTNDIEIIGFEDGYKGLIYNNYHVVDLSDFSGILTQGGTVLGTSRQPFKKMNVPDENGLDKVKADVCQRLPQIARTDDHHLVLLIQAQYRAYLIVKAVHTVTVSLLAESSEIVEILPYLRRSVPGQITELAG